MTAIVPPLPVYSSRWRKARATYLQRNPLCVLCEQRGRLTAASVVDHVVPHKGDSTLFWDTDNWQPLCTHCHDSLKRTQERSGALPGIDANGMPVDPAHHWNTR